MNLDNRTWILWGLAASLPAIVGRNPFVLLETLILIVTVRLVTGRTGEWTWAIRILAVFVVIGVGFNVLTVHSGDRAMGRIPESVPVAGGDITLNSLVYGSISGLAIFKIVLIWLHVASLLDWSMLMRQVPTRLTTIAVAGSVAWSYLPSMRRTLRDIRESQASRGWQARRVRDLPALIVPTLAGGLERSLITAEVLETRGFGGVQQSSRQIRSSFLLLGGLLALVSGIYCFSTGLTSAAAVTVTAGTLALVLELRRDTGQIGPTRLRETSWSVADTLCALASGVAIISAVVANAVNTSALTYNPYPTLSAPDVDLVLMTCLLFLLAPAVVEVMSSP
jgi:energy-coupling factor transporter transmembrane protein EcfT